MARKWRLLITTDEEGKQQIHNLHFGTVEEGQRRTLTLYMKNLEDYAVNQIECSVKDKDVSMVCPTEMDSFETKPLLVSWSIGEKTLSLEDTITFKSKMRKPVRALKLF